MWLSDNHDLEVAMVGTPLRVMGMLHFMDLNSFLLFPRYIFLFLVCHPFRLLPPEGVTKPKLYFGRFFFSFSHDQNVTDLQFGLSLHKGACAFVCLYQLTILFFSPSFIFLVFVDNASYFLSFFHFFSSVLFLIFLTFF